MLKKLAVISLLLVVYACSTSVKSSWQNFRAYYNTYYNAKRDFKAGLNAVKDQQPEIDPDTPIRIYPVPVKAGLEDFQKAIDKGAQILRKFPESKWIDESLEMIGKSYYYRGELFSALEKFEEQFSNTESSEMKQRAVLWKGRTLLELKQYETGIDYLSAILADSDLSWNHSYRAECRIVLAQHNARSGAWSTASMLLEQSLPDIGKGNVKARIYFFYGQVLEKLERFGEAYFAYGKVSENYPAYDLLYEADKKQGRMLLTMGNLDQALRKFVTMEKDDKNIQQRNEIEYEIGRTMEKMGEYEEAVSIYNGILRETRTPVSGDLRSKIYIRLGEVYSNEYKNFKMAAAYFDSASVFRNNEDLTSGDLEIGTLAEAYGQYASLRGQISRIDSLLGIADMPKSKLDSFLADVREKRIQQLQQRQKQKDRANVLYNRNRNQQGGQQPPTSTIYGFLNYRNQQLVADNQARFRAVWGDRPLVDDWRRIEVVRNITAADGNEEDLPAQQGARPSREQTLNELLDIDLSEIPFSDEARKKKKKELASIRYQLGNLFYFKLGNPDSAAKYFISVITDHPGDSLVPQSMYSLVELYRAEEETSAVNYWRDRLTGEYPESKYARRLEPGTAGESSTFNEFLTDIRSKLQDIAPDRRAAVYAEELRWRGIEHSGSKPEIASRLHYLAIEKYIQLARERTDSVLYRQFWTVTEGTGEPVPVDSLAQNGMKGINPFTNRMWDTTRTLVSEHLEYFPQSRYTKRVNTYREILSAYPGREPAAKAEPREGQPIDRKIAQTAEEQVKRESAAVYGLKGDVNPQANDGFTIIILSLRNEKNARNKVQSLAEDGYRSILTKAIVNGNVFWRISLGQFTTVQDAKKAATLLPEPWNRENFIKSIK